MLDRRNRLRIRLKQASDGFIFIGALTLAHFVRSEFPLALFPALEPIPVFWPLYLVVGLAAPVVLASQGFYRRPLIATRAGTYWVLLRSCLLLVFAAIVGAFLFRYAFARLAITFFGLFGFGLMVLKEELLRHFYHHRFTRDQFARRIVLMGEPHATASLRAMICETSTGLVEIVAEHDPGTKSVVDLVECLHLYSINTVVVSARLQGFSQVQEAISACELEGVDVVLLADFFDLRVSKVALDHCMGSPSLVFSATPNFDWQIVAKRIVDVAGAVFLGATTLPVCLVVALAVKLTSPGPVLFRQRRAGLNGRPFTMYKFRSMTFGAERFQADLIARNEMSGPVFKVTNDPRQTSVGRFLRRYSLDELPQVINVLFGEMSLVGPRPLPLEETNRFDERSHRRRLSVKPGLTCLWQINGRNTIVNFDEWLEMDLRYIDNWSFWLDLKIIFLTGPAVLAGRGAK